MASYEANKKMRPRKGSVKTSRNVAVTDEPRKGNILIVSRYGECIHQKKKYGMRKKERYISPSLKE